MEKTQETVGISAPSPLSEAESLMLRHLLKQKDQAAQNVSEYVTYIMNDRKVNVTEWAISLGDFKSIVPAQKPTQPA